MVKVKFFGTFRLDTGVHELGTDAGSVKELLEKIPAEILRISPEAQIDRKALSGCIVAVNGKQVKPGARLCSGDEVWLVPAVAGG